MKKYSIALCFLISTFFINHLSARIYSSCPYPQHEVGVGYGYMSTEQFSIVVTEFLTSAVIKPLTGDNVSTKSYQFIGPISVNYKFFFKDRLSVGASILFSSNKIEYSDANNILHNVKLNTFSIIPRFDFYYIRNPKFALYGNVGAGAVVMTSSYGQQKDLNDSGASFAFQVTPIAMRIGRDFGFVLELGIGSHGLAEGGFSYRHYDRPWNFH